MVKLFDELKRILEDSDDHERIKAILNERYKVRYTKFPFLYPSLSPLPLVDAARLHRERSLRVMLEFLDEQITRISNNNSRKKKQLTFDLKTMVNREDQSFRRGRAGFTPLTYVAENRCTNSAKLLLKFGADPNAEVGSLLSFAKLLVNRVKNYFFMKYIFDPFRDDQDERRDYGITKGSDTPLYRAVSKCHLEMVHLLLQNGAKVVPGCMIGAIRQDREEAHDICEALIRHGGDVNEDFPGYQSCRPIEEACSDWNARIVKLLLANGAKIEWDWFGKYQESPFEKIPLLPFEAYRRDPATMSDNERTYYYRQTKGYGPGIVDFKEIVRLLLEYGADPLQLVSRKEVKLHTGTNPGRLPYTEEEYERTVPAIEFYRLLEQAALRLPRLGVDIQHVYRDMVNMMEFHIFERIYRDKNHPPTLLRWLNQDKETGEALLSNIRSYFM